MCATVNHDTGCTVRSVENAYNSISSSEINSVFDNIENFQENFKTVATAENDDTFKDTQDMYQKVLSKLNDVHEKFKQEVKEKYK